MDSSGLFSHPVEQEAVRKSDASSDVVESPAFSDASQPSSEPRHS
jgi:hypothetical protein